MNSMRFAFIALVFLVLTACNQETSTDPSTAGEQQEKNVNSDDEKARSERESSDVEPSTPAEPYDPAATPLNYLEKYVGQYPSGVNFLGNVAMRARMQKLLGKTLFSQVERMWKEETLLEMQSGNIFTTAQEGPGEGDPKLALIVDPGKDLLFVAIKNFEGADDQIFAERNADIPIRLKNWAAK